MVYIFYLLLEKSKQISGYSSVWLPGAGYIKIRAEQAKSSDLLTALTEAKPRHGEVVMNTHRIDS